MKFFETSKFHTLKKSTYISLRWIGIIGQLISVYIVYFFFNFDFNFVLSNLIIFVGILSNFYLILIYNKTQLSDRSALVFLMIDIFQLGSLIYLTGGIVNPFVIFLFLVISAMRKKPAIGFLLNQVIDLNKISVIEKNPELKQSIQKTYTNTTYIISISFLLSSILNFSLAKILLKSPPGSSDFNHELGLLTAMSYPVIVVPCMIVLGIAFIFLFKKLN